jgi:RHS repeat-associated protein
VNAIAEYDGSNALQRRYVFGPGADEPIVWYEGTGTTDRRFMSADERGSIISLTDSAGTLININRYDEYGKPQSTNFGRFQYTGQKWIGEAGLYDYKARDYLPHLGIFAQTDPVGYGAGANWYAYVGNDPLNNFDPTGLGTEPATVTITGTRPYNPNEQRLQLAAMNRPGPVEASNEKGDGGGDKNAMIWFVKAHKRFLPSGPCLRLLAIRRSTPAINRRAVQLPYQARQPSDLEGRLCGKEWLRELESILSDWMMFLLPQAAPHHPTSSAIMAT